MVGYLCNGSLGLVGGRMGIPLFVIYGMDGIGE